MITQNKILNNFTWLIDQILIDTTIPEQSEAESNGNKRIPWLEPHHQI